MDREPTRRSFWRRPTVGFVCCVINLLACVYLGYALWRRATQGPGTLIDLPF